MGKGFSSALLTQAPTVVKLVENKPSLGHCGGCDGEELLLGFLDLGDFLLVASPLLRLALPSF